MTKRISSRSQIEASAADGEGSSKAGIDSKTIRRLKANENTETKTPDKLCAVLD